MINPINFIGRRFNWLAPCINSLTNFIKKILCLSAQKPVTPLMPERVSPIRKCDCQDPSVKKTPVANEKPKPEIPHSTSEELVRYSLKPDLKPRAKTPIPNDKLFARPVLPKQPDVRKPVSERIQDFYRRSREVGPSDLDAHAFCPVEVPIARSIDLDSKKRLKVLNKLREIKKNKIEEENHKRESYWDSRDLRKNEIKEAHLRFEERRKNICSKLCAKLPVLPEKRQLIKKKGDKIIGLIKARGAKETEVVHTFNSFITLREKTVQRHEPSKESIKEGYDRFKEHVQMHREIEVDNLVDPEERKRKIEASHARVLNHIFSSRTPQSSNYTEIIKGIFYQPKKAPLNPGQIQAVAFKNAFLKELKGVLANKTSADPIAVLQFFKEEFMKVNFPVCQEKLKEWRSKLNGMNHRYYESVKEGIAQIITHQLAYHELPEYAKETRKIHLDKSQELFKTLRLMF